jgi:hypothetical protein
MWRMTIVQTRRIMKAVLATATEGPHADQFYVGVITQ